MSKVFWQMSVTLDGYMEGVDHDLTLTSGFMDPDFENYAGEMLQSIAAVVLGRRTYELFAGYWPNQSGADAQRLNALPKTVFSHTLEKVEWNNSRLAGKNVTAEISHLKRDSGGDIAVFGSATLAATLMQLGLIDEYRVFVTPTILGHGERMFPVPGVVPGPFNLKLENAVAWSSGTVALTYRAG